MSPAIENSLLSYWENSFVVDEARALVRGGGCKELGAAVGILFGSLSWILCSEGAGAATDGAGVDPLPLTATAKNFKLNYTLI